MSSGGLVSCVGGCNSKLFNSRRVHRPLIELNSDKALKFFEPRQSTDTSEQSSNRQNRLESITLPMPSVANVKKSRKRRDRRLSGIPNDTTIRIEHDSDDEDTPKSQSLTRRCMFWFCGILIVIVGVGALLYAIITLCTSMDRVTKFIQTADTKRMFTESWRTKDLMERIKRSNWT